MLPIHQRRAPSPRRPQNQESSEVTLNSYRDSATLVEPIADEQTSQPAPRPPQLLQQQSQQQQSHQRPPQQQAQQLNRPRIHDVQLAFPGYFDPLTADPITNTAMDIKVFARMLTTLPRLLYFSLFFFLPFFYRTRVNQIFRGVHLTENEIALRYASGLPLRSWRPKHWDEVKESWTSFIDSVVKEWATLNIISVLLLSAIYNVLQLGGGGSRLVQCTALMSLISALTSLVLGCLYVIRFETMRRPYKAMEWVQSAVHSSRSVLWNIFILLSLPFVWLSWSILFFIICLMSVIWQKSAQTTSGRSLVPLSLEVKIIVSVLLFFGVIHLCLILVAFSQYGDIDENWTERFKRIARPASMADGSTAGGAPPPPQTGPPAAQQQQHKGGVEIHQPAQPPNAQPPPSVPAANAASETLVPSSQPQTQGATGTIDSRHVSFQLPSQESTSNATTNESPGMSAPPSQHQNPQIHITETPEPSPYPVAEPTLITPMAPEQNMSSLPVRPPDQPYRDNQTIPQSTALPPPAQHYSNYGRTPTLRAGSTPFDLVPPFSNLTPYFYGNYQTAQTAVPPLFMPPDSMMPPFTSSPYYYGGYPTTPATAPSGRPRSNSFLPPFTSTGQTPHMWGSTPYASVPQYRSHYPATPAAARSGFDSFLPPFTSTGQTPHTWGSTPYASVPQYRSNYPTTPAAARSGFDSFLPPFTSHYAFAPQANNVLPAVPPPPAWGPTQHTSLPQYSGEFIPPPQAYDVPPAPAPPPVPLTPQAPQAWGYSVPPAPAPQTPQTWGSTPSSGPSSYMSHASSPTGYKPKPYRLLPYSHTRHRHVSSAPTPYESRPDYTSPPWERRAPEPSVSVQPATSGSAPPEPSGAVLLSPLSTIPEETSSTMVSPVQRRPEELHNVLQQHLPPGFEPISYQPFVRHNAGPGENTEPQMIQMPRDFAPVAHQPAVRRNAELGEDPNNTEPTPPPVTQRRSASDVTPTTQDEKANIQSTTPSSTLATNSRPYPSASAASSSHSSSAPVTSRPQDKQRNIDLYGYELHPRDMGGTSRPQDKRRDLDLYGYELPPHDTGGNSPNTQTDRVQAAEEGR